MNCVVLMSFVRIVQRQKEHSSLCYAHSKAEKTEAQRMHVTCQRLDNGFVSKSFACH